MSINYENDLQKIKDLVPGKHTYVFWFSDGGGVVYCINGVDGIEYELFEVGQYGGFENFVDTYKEDQIEELLRLVYTWT